MQPSAQGIASLFMGNPGALQQKIQKEQQANPGLPPDLKKLMALNIVTNEADAAKQQAAINALNQMAPAGQEPPTVAQSIQEQAKQKMQAQMLQQMRQQQGLAELAKQQMGQIPENVPQPERQPQGIDELPVEFGMAGGGIVAFQNGGVSPEFGGTVGTYVPLEKRSMDEVAKLIEAERAKGKSIGLSDIQDMIDRRGRYKEDPITAAPIAAPTRSAPAPAPSPATSRPPRPAPAPVAQAPAQQLMPPGVNEEMVLPEQTMNPIAMARADATRREKEFEERVGRPDYTAIDRLMAELERQKAATVGPERGFAGLMEFLGQIAATPRGLSSMEAGAMGARGVQALEREREARRSGLIEKQIELEQKKIDSNRQYAKDVFGVGTNEFDRMLKANMDMFKEKGENNRLALRHANEKVLADLKNERDIAAAELKYKRDKELAAMRLSGQDRTFEREVQLQKLYAEDALLKRYADNLSMAMMAPPSKESTARIERLRAAIKDRENVLAATLPKVPGKQGTTAAPADDKGGRTIDWNTIK
jgi:hypothetical protein